MSHGTRNLIQNKKNRNQVQVVPKLCTSLNGSLLERKSVVFLNLCFVQVSQLLDEETIDFKLD